MTGGGDEDGGPGQKTVLITEGEDTGGNHVRGSSKATGGDRAPDSPKGTGVDRVRDCSKGTGGDRILGSPKGTVGDQSRDFPKVTVVDQSRDSPKVTVGDESPVTVGDGFILSDEEGSDAEYVNLSLIYEINQSLNKMESIKRAMYSAGCEEDEAALPLKRTKVEEAPITANHLEVVSPRPKRNLEDEDQSEQILKRSKYDSPIVAESPHEPSGILVALRNIMRRSKELQLEKRDVRLEKRELRLEKREDRLEKREDRLEKREDNLVLLEHQKDLTLEQRKAQFDKNWKGYQDFLLYRSAIENSVAPATEDAPAPAAKDAPAPAQEASLAPAPKTSAPAPQKVPVPATKTSAPAQEDTLAPASQKAPAQEDTLAPAPQKVPAPAPSPETPVPAPKTSAPGALNRVADAVKTGVTTVTEKLESADKMTTLVEKVVAAPTRVEELRKSYEENKVIVSTIKKSYDDKKEAFSAFKTVLGGVVTSSLLVAKQALKELARRGGDGDLE